MAWLPTPVSSRERAAALLIVLAFVVLLTGLSVAYLSRTTGDRQVAHSSFNQSNVDQLAQSAMDNIIGDLRQEITDLVGSTTINCKCKWRQCYHLYPNVRCIHGSSAQCKSYWRVQSDSAERLAQSHSSAGAAESCFCG